LDVTAVSETLVEATAAPAGATRRIAVALQEPSERDAFVALLAAGGLPVNSGAMPLDRLEEIIANAPDAIVLVADVLQLDSLAALRRVRRELPSARIVAVGADEGASGRRARQALNAGADAFVTRLDAERTLAAAVHAVLAGLVCAPRDVRRLLAKPTFSHREKEVLGLLVAGKTNREIAQRLFVSESTVKTHLMSAFTKLGVRSRKDAASLLLDPVEGLAAIALPPVEPRN
jgi:DNA-binding NarL/FixJ family response regulator